MNKILIVLITTFLLENKGFSQIASHCEVLLINNAQEDSVGMFDKISLSATIKNNDTMPIDFGQYDQTHTGRYFTGKMEYHLEGDSVWHSYEPFYGNISKILPNLRIHFDYIRVNPGETLVPVPLNLNAFFFIFLHPDNKLIYKKPFSVYIRIVIPSPQKIKYYYSNTIKINLHTYASSTVDHDAFFYLMSTKNPGILTPCISEHNYTPCVFPDSNDLSVLDTLTILYPTSKFTCWAHAILAITDMQYFNKPLSSYIEPPPDSSDTNRLSQIEPELLIIRRVRKHVLLALSANNAAVKTELSYWGMDRPNYFKNALHNIFYSKFNQLDVIPKELLEEFESNK
jgi:hypothetical protein